MGAVSSEQAAGGALGWPNDPPKEGYTEASCQLWTWGEGDLGREGSSVCSGKIGWRRSTYVLLHRVGIVLMEFL